MAALFGAAFSLCALAQWIWLSPPPAENLAKGLWLPLAALAASAVGGLWWGAVARSESALFERLLSATLVIGALVFLALANFAQRPSLAAGPLGPRAVESLAIFGFFMWGAAPTFLPALAFPGERGVGRGLFTIYATGLFAAAAGLLCVSALALACPLRQAWIADAAGVFALALAVWVKATRRRPGKAAKDSRDISEFALQAEGVTTLNTAGDPDGAAIPHAAGVPDLSLQAAGDPDFPPRAADDSDFAPRTADDSDLAPRTADDSDTAPRAEGVPDSASDAVGEPYPAPHAAGDPDVPHRAADDSDIASLTPPETRVDSPDVDPDADVDTFWDSPDLADPDEPPLRFWPARSLGYFTFESGRGQELLVYGSAFLTLKPAAFLGAAAAGGAAALAALSGSPAQESFPEPWGAAFLIPLALALGAAALGPALAAVASPMTALGLNLFLLSLFMAFGPTEDGLPQAWLRLLAPLTLLGALWPMAARVTAGGKGFFPLTLAGINLWILAGAAGGAALFTGLSGARPEAPLADALSYLALAAAFLAAGPSLSWLFTGVLGLCAALLYYFT
jgi:hypothetical protein